MRIAAELWRVFDQDLDLMPGASGTWPLEGPDVVFGQPLCRTMVAMLDTGFSILGTSSKDAAVDE